jgi:hypothetical protein
VAVVLAKKKVLPGQVAALADEAFAYAESTYGRDNHSTKANLRLTLQAWVDSVPYDVYDLPIGAGKYVAKAVGPMKLGSVLPTLGMDDAQPKAWWKQFNTKEELFKHLVLDADTRVLANRALETTHANAVLAHAKTARVLNDLRRALGDYFWTNDSYAGWASYYATTNPLANLLPNWTGSYNEANSYPGYERSEQWEYADLNDQGDGIYNVVAFAMNWVAQPIFDYSVRRKDRMSLGFDKRDFTVAENVAILHDLKELFSPRNNSRLFGTWHRTLVPHPYQGANSPDAPTRWADGRDDRCAGDHRRVDILKKDTAEKNPLLSLKPHATTKQERLGGGEIKWDQGRNGAGTRNEDSPDTRTARLHTMPIETGRSHTAARLFEMVSLLKPDRTAGAEANALFADRIKAMVYGIFGYWNADVARGGYPKSLTPIHTYHEVMDPAEDYLPGIYSEPFGYGNVTTYLRG